jgi:hypothetical protein
MRGATTGAATCERIIERLVDGARPTDDPEVGAHLSSCLRCYRAAADLRDVPQLTGLLREAQAELERHDSPGEAFWRSFPTAMGAAWTGARGSQESQDSTTSATADVRWQPWQRLRAWLRRPMPAAFAGAACAAAVAFMVLRPPSLPPGLEAPVPAASSLRSAEDGMVGVALDDVPLPRSQGLDDSVRDLDDVSLGELLEGLDRDLGSSAAADPDLSREADLDVADVAAAGKLEELDDLELEGLQALRDGLGRSI